MKSVSGLLFFAAAFWSALWLTADQQGQRLLQRGDPEAAAQAFEDPMWKGVAWYRAGEFAKAEQVFARISTPESKFNRGNCLVLMGKYDAAVELYDTALEQRPTWDDAITNRTIAAARAEMLDQPGGDMGDQRIGADEIKFDRNQEQPGGPETQVSGEQVLSDSAMQAIWLRRVQTKPADFLRAKFAFQLSDDP